MGNPTSDVNEYALLPHQLPHKLIEHKTKN
jgi:hypothetical protein